MPARFDAFIRFARRRRMQALPFGAGTGANMAGPVEGKGATGARVLGKGYRRGDDRA